MKLTNIFPEAHQEQNKRLQNYCNLLKDWNQRINLISRRDMEKLDAHHIWPSIIPLKFIELEKEAWVLDIGSGGGLPAIPLKILRPDLTLLMVDSVRKKTFFLQHVIDELQLPNTSVINQRVEKLAENFDFKKKFHIITARAVGKIDILLDLGMPYLKHGGYFLLWKGQSDIADLKKNAEKYRYKYEVHSVPEQWRGLSPKFKELCWFQIWF